ncbi:hypothetical protein Q9Q99_15710 [Curtobacterium flaccumfaciens]|nr:hypothetical protein Q9Q99_15710 [Curtobacterium flaccumfaciens]
MALLDLALLLTAFAIAHVVRFPWELASVRPRSGWFEFVVAPAIVVVWMLLLSAFRTRDPRIAGIGGEEYRRLVTASLVAIAGVAVVVHAAQLDLAPRVRRDRVPAGARVPGARPQGCPHSARPESRPGRAPAGRPDRRRRRGRPVRGCADRRCAECRLPRAGRRHGLRSGRGPCRPGGGNGSGRRGHR